MDDKRSVFPKSYNGLDIGKLLCSILIVALHTNPLETYNKLLNYGLVNYLTRIAVPFFFICSGFLLFRKMSYENCDYYRIRQYVFKVLRLYIIWSLIYFPIRLYSIIMNHPKGYVYSFLGYLRDLLFVGGYSQLWYLNATIVAVVCVAFFLYKKYSVKSILITSIILYIIGLLTQSYFAILRPLQQYDYIWEILRSVKKVIVTSRNGLFFGLLFITIGMIISWRKIRSITRGDLITLFFVSMILFLIEAYMVHKLGSDYEHNMYIFMVPSAIFFFLIMMSMDLKDRPIYLHFRKLSSLIFYGHLWVSVVVNKGLNVLGNKLDQNLDNSLIRFSLILIITFGCSELIIWLSDKPKLVWLRKLYY